MEMFIFRHQEWSRLYNCTGINVDSIPFEQRHQFVPEAWALIVLSTIYYFLYIPCMISIWKHIAENVCYKLLFYIGIFDLAILWILGYVQAIYSLNGIVFCSSPLFNYWIGISETSFWFAESNADLVLAFNRCLDLLSPKVSDMLFSGFRIHIWLSICTIYALCWVIFLKPTVYSSLFFAWYFDPFIGYREDLDDQFVVPLHAFHDGAVALLSPLIYVTFAIAMCIKTRSFGFGQAISGPQKMAFLQVLLISAMNAVSCSVYVLMHFFNPPQWLITLAQFSWFHVHGFPPVIYLALNKTIRHDCRMMFYKVFCPNRVQHLNGITRYFTTECGWFLDHGGGWAARVVQPNSAGNELVYVTTNNYYKSGYDVEDSFIYDYAQLMLPSNLATKTLPFPISASRDPDSSVSGGPVNVLRFANFERQKNSSFAGNDIVAVYHSHSKYATLLSGLHRPGDILRLNGEQALTGVENRQTGRQLLFNQTAIIPIIQNSPNEGSNPEPVILALSRWPNASAVLVHRHGLYVIGQVTWGRTKQMAECYEYLLEVEYERRQAKALGLLRK